MMESIGAIGRSGGSKLLAAMLLITAAVCSGGIAATARAQNTEDPQGSIEDQANGDAPAAEGERRPSDRQKIRAERKERLREGKGLDRAGVRDAVGMRRQMLDFSAQYFEAVQEPYRALGFAAIGIKDYHRRSGKPEQAVPELEAILARTKNQKARNVVLFVIRQIHESTGDSAKFIEVNNRIVEENLAATAGK